MIARRLGLTGALGHGLRARRRRLHRRGWSARCCTAGQGRGGPRARRARGPRPGALLRLLRLQQRHADAVAGRAPVRGQPRRDAARARPRANGWRVRDYRTGRKAARAGLAGAIAGVVDRDGGGRAGTRRSSADPPGTAFDAQRPPPGHGFPIVPMGYTTSGQGDGWSPTTTAAARPGRAAGGAVARPGAAGRPLRSVPRPAPAAAADALGVSRSTAGQQGSHGSGGEGSRAGVPTGGGPASVPTGPRRAGWSRSSTSPRGRRRRVRPALRPLPRVGVPVRLLPGRLRGAGRGPHLARRSSGPCAAWARSAGRARTSAPG